MATASRRCTMMSAYLWAGEQMEQEAIQDAGMNVQRHFVRVVQRVMSHLLMGDVKCV